MIWKKWSLEERAFFMSEIKSWPANHCGEFERCLARLIPSRPGWNGLVGVIRTETALGFRKAQIPFLTAGLLVFCQALIPPLDAPYAVLTANNRSEEHTSELQSLRHLVCRLLLE